MTIENTKKNKNRILVTGAAGFIGSNLWDGKFMKQAEKESAAELARILQKANSEVKKNIAALSAILSECQSGAISLGTMIEESEGEGFCTVRILEEYCEQRKRWIYIHNPYDEGNFVTSVHSFFYSSNLKQYTDKLIYIPYFVLAEPQTPDDIKSLEGMAHFVTVSAVVHADQVIVQSENMRRAYITVMTDYAGEQTRKIWEDKIIGSGSPKFDKILAAKKEEQNILDELMKKL